MMTDRELLEQALYVFNAANSSLYVKTDNYPLSDMHQQIVQIQDAISARLAEDDEEPVLWVDTDDNGDLYWDEDRMVSDTPVYFDNPIPLYRRPLPMARLTDEEIFEVVREASRGSALMRDGSTSLRIARAIERRINGDNP